MNPTVVSVIIAIGGLASCGEDRYRANLAHAYVTPWTHLSRQDHEAIVRLISTRDSQPIIGIAAHRPRQDGSTISVYTGNLYQTEHSLWHGYDLKKENGEWRVTFDGDCSHTIAGLDLSGDAHKLDEKRRR